MQLLDLAAFLAGRVDRRSMPTAAERYLRAVSRSRRSGDLLVLCHERAMVRSHMLMLCRDVLYRREVFEACVRNFAWTSVPLDRTELERIEHVRDWIEGAVASEAEWLRRVDEKGRPLKLTKIGSLDRAVREADKAMRRIWRPADPADGERPYAELPDGWSIVRLTTHAALGRESSLMQHCVGNGSYDVYLKDRGRAILSLRDPAGAPHVTVAVEGLPSRMRIVEMQGKQNRKPLPAYMDRLGPLLERTSGRNAYASILGSVVDRQGRRHRLDELPDELVVAGDLELDLNVAPETRMPATSIRVRGGSLRLRGVGGRLPLRLRARDSVRIMGSFGSGPSTTVKANMASLGYGSIGSALDLAACDILLVLGCETTSIGLPKRMSLVEIRNSKVASLVGPCVVDKAILHRTDIAKKPDAVAVRNLEMDAESVVAGSSSQDWPAYRDDVRSRPARSRGPALGWWPSN